MTTISLSRPLCSAAVRLALRLFAEETAATQRRASVAPLERETAGRVARWFVVQGRVVVRVWGQVMADRLDREAERRGTTTEGAARAALTEDISWNDWDYLLNGVLMGNHPGGMLALRDVIADGRTTAYATGAEETLGGTGLGVRFAVGSAEAVAHARETAARQVTRINDTTRSQLRTVITQAVEHGWSWQRTAEAITARYAEFAGKPLFPSATFKSRAEMIAAYEIGDAYEAGGEAQARALAAEGVPMEKSWMSAGDARVRDTHRANEAAGWIPLEAAFPDGSMRGQTDPGCRCATLYRPRADAFDGEEPEPTAVTQIGIDSVSLRPEYAGHGVQESIFRTDESERARQRAMKLATRWERYARLGDLTLDLDLQIAQAMEAGEPEEVLVALERKLKRAVILRKKAADHYHNGVRSALALPKSLQSRFTTAVHLRGHDRVAAQAALDDLRQFVSEATLPGGVRVGVGRSEFDRAYARGNDIYLTDSPLSHTGSVVFHEVGHVIEKSSELPSELSWAFHRRRTRGEYPVSLNDLHEYNSYDVGELTYRDEFIDPYMGKLYENGETEIISTGLQYMRYSPEDLAARDPDYFHFMYHLLRGDLMSLAEKIVQ